jgi:hypothetical protein
MSLEEETAASNSSFCSIPIEIEQESAPTGDILTNISNAKSEFIKGKKNCFTTRHPLCV